MRYYVNTIVECEDASHVNTFVQGLIDTTFLNPEEFSNGVILDVAEYLLSSSEKTKKAFYALTRGISHLDWHEIRIKCSFSDLEVFMTFVKFMFQIAGPEHEWMIPIVSKGAGNDVVSKQDIHFLHVKQNEKWVATDHYDTDSLIAILTTHDPLKLKITQLENELSKAQYKHASEIAVLEEKLAAAEQA